MDAVKASQQQQKAASTRRRMVAAAYDLFCELGYRATTMTAIADRAGVAVQTLYFTFHTKDALLQEVHKRTVMGEDPTPPTQQGWYLKAVAEPEVTRAIPLVVEGTAVILARVAPMLPVFHAVAADAAGAVFRKGEDRRRRDVRRLAELMLSKRGTSGSIGLDQAADLFHVLLGPEIYKSFVIDLGWTPHAWVRWTSTALLNDLRGPPVTSAKHSGNCTETAAP